MLVGVAALVRPARAVLVASKTELLRRHVRLVLELRWKIRVGVFNREQLTSDLGRVPLEDGQTVRKLAVAVKADCQDALIAAEVDRELERGVVGLLVTFVGLADTFDFSV